MCLPKIADGSLVFCRRHFDALPSALNRNVELRSKLLTLGKTKINLVFLSHNRNFAQPLRTFII